MLIFDTFQDLEQAEAFARETRVTTQLGTAVYTDIMTAQEADPIPVMLNPPVVHVDRTAEWLEDAIVKLVDVYGGVFVGT